MGVPPARRALPVREGHRAAEAPARAAPGPEEAFQFAAASEALLEREQIKTAVSRDGVRLFDVAPEHLSLTAVNRYLDIKARGVL